MESKRVIKAARGLFRRYQNPDVAAFNRAYRAKTEKNRLFWHNVGHFLFWPYRGMAWTSQDVQRWKLIRAERAE